MTHIVTDESFDADVLKASGLVLVDFWAEWCGPCRALSPILGELEMQMGNKIKIVKVNIDDNPETPSEYNVRSIPTLVLFKDGAPVSTKIGLLSKTALEEWIQGAL